MFGKIAWLNLWKHKKRTLLILFAVMMSVLVMEVVAGMFAGMRINFFRNLTQEGGHVQINRAGWEDRLNPYTLDYLIPGYGEVLEAVRGMDGVAGAEPLIHSGALVQNGGKDVSMAGIGLKPENAFYRNVQEGMTAGKFLPGGEGIALSRRISRLLDLEQGDPVNVVVEDSTGSPFYLQFPVTGVFQTDSREFDENTFFISHRAAQDLLYLGPETTEIRVRLTDSALAPGFKKKAEARLSGGEGKLLIRTWRDLNSGMTAMLEMMDFFVFIMDIFVVIVVATVITNAILMNVFERIREFGTMRAIGMKRRQIRGMILAEGLIQGAVGGILGLAVGIPVVLYFAANGLDWGGISEAFGMGSSQFYFGYSVRNSLISYGSGLLIALGGSFYAARTGTRMSIMETLQGK